MEMKNMENADEIAAFMTELTANRPAQASRGPQTRYEVLKPTFGQIYRNYALVSFNKVDSELNGENYCLRMVNLDTDRREKIYLGGYERNDFERFITQNDIITDGDDGKKVYNLPVKIDFLRAQEESKKNPGRKFNTFNALPRGAITREELPEVPADQIVDPDAE
jgi:hypothetical protein|tara:strand:+ start:1560 stop:2054 length:495 start_codon:yes stop_codon:yes gene_type:complete